MSVNSDIFESEPEYKTNFTKVPREISKNKNHKNNIDEENPVKNKRTHETAFSVKCNAPSINNIKNNEVVKITNQSETVQQQITLDEDQEGLHHHKDVECCIKESITKMTELIGEVQLDLTTEDKCTQDMGHTFMTPLGISDQDFTKEIKEKLPRMSAAQVPVSRTLLIYELSQLTKNSDQDWKPFSKERRRELKRFESTLFFNQLSRNNFVHAWKQIYEDVNEYCDTFCIPYKNQRKLYILEMQFLSLYMHNIMPERYNDQGIYPHDKSISNYAIFFNEDDPISTARQKWLDFIIEDYFFFWDVFANKIKFSELSDQNIVKIHDIFEIVNFINPQAIQRLLRDPNLFNLMKLICLRAIDREHYVYTRHSAYYAWMIYGWRPLNSELPS